MRIKVVTILYRLQPWVIDVHVYREIFVYFWRAWWIALDHPSCQFLQAHGSTTFLWKLSVFTRGACGTTVPQKCFVWGYKWITLAVLYYKVLRVRLQVKHPKCFFFVYDIGQWHCSNTNVFCLFSHNWPCTWCNWSDSKGLDVDSKFESLQDNDVSASKELLTHAFFSITP